MKCPHCGARSKRQVSIVRVHGINDTGWIWKCSRCSKWGDARVETPKCSGTPSALPGRGSAVIAPLSVLAAYLL
jgi:hypothetical protein